MYEPDATYPTPAPSEDQSISVEIYDQVYHLRGTDPTYIEHLARLVDAKMRAVSAQGGTVDSLRVAVLASLNIADELVCLRDRYNQLAGLHHADAVGPCARARPRSPACWMKSSKKTQPAIRRAG